MHRPGMRTLVAALVIVGAVLRALPMTAALPYLAYVDEGHVLHSVERMLATGTWDPAWYRYPPLLMNAIALVHRATNGGSGAAVAGGSPYYDVVQPTSLIVEGRLLVFATAAGTVAMVAWLGARLVGRRVAIVAALLAAVLPALVSRSAIVIVDTPSAFLVTVTLVACTFLADGGGHGVALITGLAAGLAAAAKYPAGLVAVAALVAVVSASLPARARATHALTLLAAIGGGFVLGCPPALFRTTAVLRDLRVQAATYAGYAATQSCLTQALRWSELGPVFLVLAVVGVASMLRSPRARPVTLGWLAVAIILVALQSRYAFQPFRNLLPLVPFACVAAATAIVRLAETLTPRHGAPAAAIVASVVASLSFVWGVRPYLAAQVGRVDSRVDARRWLETHRRPDDAVVIVAELAFAPDEVARLGANVTVVPRVDVPRVVEEASPTYVVAGAVAAAAPAAVGDAWRRSIAARRLVFAVGRTPTPAGSGFWRGNDERVVVYGAPPPGG